MVLRRLVPCPSVLFGADVSCVLVGGGACLVAARHLNAGAMSGVVVVWGHTAVQGLGGGYYVAR